MLNLNVVNDNEDRTRRCLAPHANAAPRRIECRKRERLIKKAVDAKEAGADHIEVWGTGSASREFLYVDDAAAGIVAAAERYDDGDPVNLGTDHEMPIRELVGYVAEATGFTGELRWDATKPDGQPRRRVDNTRARERFGFEATTSFPEGLRATVDWYLANQPWWESLLGRDYSQWLRTNYGDRGTRFE